MNFSGIDPLKVTELIEVSQRSGISLTWDEAREYLERIERIANDMKNDDSHREPCIIEWSDIVPLLDIINGIKLGIDIPEKAAKTMLGFLIGARRELDRLQAINKSLEHALNAIKE